MFFGSDSGDIRGEGIGVEMNRREFFKRAGILGALAASNPKALVSFLAEGVKKKVTRSSGVVVTGSFPKALWPGIEKFYADHYESDYPLFKDVFK